MINSGYIKNEFENTKLIKNIKKKIEIELSKILKRKTKLENYHLLNLSNDKHKKTQWKIATYFWKKKFHVELMKSIFRTASVRKGADVWGLFVCATHSH